MSTIQAIEVPSSLTQNESEILGECEAIIEQDLEAFINVGLALLKIRDGGLYRENYATFEEYVRERWDYKRSRAYQLMDAAHVVTNVHNCGQILPANEGQARPLVPLTPAEQCEVWQRVVATAPGGRITAAWVESVVEQYKPQKERVDWSEYAVSTSDDEAQIIRWIMDLYNGGKRFDLDPAYSTGRVWKGLPKPRYRSDLNPCVPHCEKADVRHLPYKDESLHSIYFDPPYLAKDPGREGGKLGIMEGRFSGYKSVPELWRMYADALREFYRVLAPGGLVAFKCMDMISGSKFYGSSVEIANRAREIGFYLAYVMVLYRKGIGMMAPSMEKQQNPRHNHVYYFVLVKEDEG